MDSRLEGEVEITGTLRDKGIDFYEAQQAAAIAGVLYDNRNNPLMFHMDIFDALSRQQKMKGTFPAHFSQRIDLLFGYGLIQRGGKKERKENHYALTPEGLKHFPAG